MDFCFFFISWVDFFLCKEKNILHFICLIQNVINSHYKLFISGNMFIKQVHVLWFSCKRDILRTSFSCVNVMCTCISILHLDREKGFISWYYLVLVVYKLYVVVLYMPSISVQSLLSFTLRTCECVFVIDL